MDGFLFVSQCQLQLQEELLCCSWKKIKFSFKPVLSCQDSAFAKRPSVACSMWTWGGMQPLLPGAPSCAQHAQSWEGTLLSPEQ